MISSEPQFTSLETSFDSKIFIIRFNRPKRKNAISLDTYKEVIEALEYAKNNVKIQVVVFTGNGDHYSSGNDLSVFMDMSDEQSINSKLEHAKNLLIDFVNAFIYFPKILVAAVNGPAIGIAATSLAHFDFVYGSSSCSISTPFVPLAQSPEACSSHLFPERMGHLKANEVLLLGKKLNAQEALRFGFLNDIYSDNELFEKVMSIARKLSESPPESLIQSKKLIRSHEILKNLEEINRKEVDILVSRWKSTEFMETIMKFMVSKTKGKL